MFFSLPKLYKIGILSMITIIIFSFIAFYFFQVITEKDLKDNLLTEQIDRQLANSKSVSQHIGSDLTLVMTVLDGMTNFASFQEGELYGEEIKALMKERFPLIQGIVDKIFVLDKNDVVTVSLTERGTENVGADFSQREWVTYVKNDLKPIFSKGFEKQGLYTLYIAIPIINRENNQYVGLIGASIPTEKFFARYGNVHDINSQFLVVFDETGTILAVGADRSLVGKNFFGNVVQSFINHNEILNNLTRTLLRGIPNYAIYDYGKTERINTGQPIFVRGEPRYFLEVVTPTKTIFSKIEETLFMERLKNTSLLVGVFASIMLFVILLLRWNSTMEKEVIKRTAELNDSNTSLDIMARKLTNANVSLYEANERLKKHQKVQQEFIDMAAHELRTPIQPILGLADVLRDRISDTYERGLLDVIMRNAKRLQRFSTEILDVTKIEGSLLKLSKIEIDLNEKIENVISDIENGVSTEINGKKNKIVFQRRESITVFVDKDRIYQVISNLLTNALKYTENGTVTINAYLNHNNHHKEAIVSISDTGRGIDSQVISKLFSKFTTTSMSGTGLGLYISRGIIEAHGGRIWAENNPHGIGATFSFSLPVK
ncbi:MAG TPA: sensor histidine kinase [Nitrososphaeraceae archaeon]|nr:sensor histidine kinase [Nitrososphaeraceae archaeon]